MSLNKTLLVILVITFTIFQSVPQVQCTTEKVSNDTESESESVSLKQRETGNSSSSRSARLMKILKDSQRRYRLPPQIRSRADRFPIEMQQRGLPVVYHRHSYPGPQRPQILRRVHNNIIPTGPQRPQQYFTYEPIKSSRYSPAKLAGPVQFTNGKASVYRPQYAAGVQQQQHPNALVPQVPSQQYLQNFKASPHFNGNAIVRPAAEELAQYQQQYAQEQQQQQLQQQQQQQQQAQYQEVQQYPIPQQHQTSQYAEQQQKQYQTQQYLNQREQYPRPGYPVPSQAQTQPQSYQPQSQHYQPIKANQESLLKEKPAIVYNNPTAQQSYSVYEESDAADRTQVPFHQQQQLQNQPSRNLYATSTEKSSQDAQNYLKFMATNEYFLPKHDPNYKKLDAETDRRQYQQQQQEPEQQQQQQQHQYSQSLAADSSNSASYNKLIQVSQLFAQQDPSPSAAIVRGSYQAGNNNLFVVNSDGNKAVKHIPNSQLAVAQQSTTPAAPTYSQVRYNAVRSRTPEPLRFEFTERDAVPASYTNSPPLRYKGVGTPTAVSSTTTPTTTTNNYKPISELEDDPEDGEDMQEASSDIYGRVPVHPQIGTSSEPPTEQKDTEDYCERICANVQDDDEEIVCGSDGYMYTSEAQLECYSSCLHIDVTIQGKGSCSAR